MRAITAPLSPPTVFQEDSMFRLPGLVALSALFLALLGTVAEPQCIGSDQLDGGPCCAPAQPKLPFFPPFKQDALEVCWRNCNVDAVIGYRAVWKNVNIAPSTGTPCGVRSVTLDLIDTTGALAWAGGLTLQYARTWLETHPSGVTLQVWRFLANGDMRPASAAAVIPCPVPSCVPAHNNRARFSGYVDYAAACGISPVSYQKAWMLTHACDSLDHVAGFPRAGVFHPDRSYSFVGPAAGFVPAALQPLEGTPGSIFETLRSSRIPVPGTTGPITCTFEERVANFTLGPGGTTCLCGPAAAPPQFLIAPLNLLGSCGTTITTPGGPFLPGFVSMGIGSWTIPGTFPGVEAVRWTAGQYDQLDPCLGFLRREIYHGATTIGGYPATQLLVSGPTVPLPLTFIDQSNSVRPTTGLIMNVPYISDRFLGLNH
jgi:hypothetical protein